MNDCRSRVGRPKRSAADTHIDVRSLVRRELEAQGFRPSEREVEAEIRFAVENPPRKLNH